MTPSLVTSEGPGWPQALPLLPHPAEIVVGIIAFAILYWIYSSKVVPSMERMYAERTRRFVDKSFASQLGTIKIRA